LFLGFWVLIVTLFLFLGLSLIFGAIILRMKRAQVVLNLGQFVFMFLCGIFFPFSILPDFVQFISKLIPISYAVDLFRNTLIGSTPELISDSFVQSLGLGSFLNGYWFEFILLHILTIISCIFGWFYYASQQNRIRTQEGLSNY
jgi:ABC-type polysaccharide/polyol phosphate export permease